MFDSPHELARKIRLGEDSLLELKSVRFAGRTVSGPARNHLADELAAMANTAGGVCVLGVDDRTRDVEGISIERLDEVERFLREVCNDSVTPPLSVTIVRMELPGAKRPSRPSTERRPSGKIMRGSPARRIRIPWRIARLSTPRLSTGNARSQRMRGPSAGKWQNSSRVM